MKRSYRLEKGDGSAELATVSLEAEAVTVARRDEQSRSKGRPIRIPLMRCQGKSIEQEARAQQLKLQAEGFVFMKEEGDPLEAGIDKFLYLIVRSEHMGDVIDYVTGCEMPPGVMVGSYHGGRLTVSDDVGQEALFRMNEDTSIVLKAVSPFAGLALLLKNEGLAELVYESSPGPSGSEHVTAGLLYSLACCQTTELSCFLRERGIASPGVITLMRNQQAVLL